MMGSFACACYTDSWLMAVTRGALRRSRDDTGRQEAPLTSSGRRIVQARDEFQAAVGRARSTWRVMAWRVALSSGVWAMPSPQSSLADPGSRRNLPELPPASRRRRSRRADLKMR